MPITLTTGPRSSSQELGDDSIDIVAVHDINEDSIEAWTDPISHTLWLRDLLPENLRNYRALIWSYKADPFTAPGTRSTQSILAHANNLVADLYADRQLENAFDRPIIFVCHGFGGLLVKRALAYSSSRESIALEHLRSIYTCTYGILFLGTPHNGVSKESLLSNSTGPSHFMLSLLKGSEMLNEINDQFAPLMKQFAIFNFWEELETQVGSRSYYVVDQESAAPAWDNVEKCGIVATHSTMAKFESRKDRRFRPVLEALSRYARIAPALVKTRLSKDEELMDQKRQHTIGELTRPQYHRLSQIESNPQDYNEWCLIPRKSSTYFTGRQKHAKLVKDKFGPIQKRIDQVKSNILVIYGLGGSGKTQFCLKYVEDNKHKYWGVFWIDASSEENVENGYAFIGTQAGKGSTKASAIHWLSQCKLPWLLVLDNADDPDVDISAHYPSEGNGHVLITTRNPNAIEHATVGHLRFRGMEPTEAVSLLLKAAYPTENFHIPPGSPVRWQLAEGIAIELGYLPLAIAHAGATIRRNIYTLERYLKYYLPHRKAMLSHSQVMSVDDANIITTWEIPFQKIVSRVSIEHRDAVDLMHMFAFMHHETIPERIFQRSWADLKISQPSLKSCPDVLRPVWSEGAQARFRRAVGILCDHSIIEYEPQQGLCTMHPVVHNWARARLSEAEQISWLRCTTAILAQCVSPYLETSGRQFRALLLPHISSCLQFQRFHNAQDSETLGSAAELEKFAWVYAEQGQWKNARQLQERVVRIRKQILGRRHKDTIRAQNSLGQTLWNLFEFKPAGEIQREILNALRWRRPTYGDWMIWPVWLPTHTSYCLALSEVTSILWLAGERSLSKWTGERAVTGLTQRLGPEDPLTLKAMFHLARTYLHLGEQEKCHQLLLWVLKHQKRFFGMKHPDTLMTRNELGMFLCASKRHLPAAQRLVENVLQARRQLLGEEHAYTLWSINDLSKIYIEVGRADDAVTMLENIVPIVIRTLGEKHVGMSMTRTNLGRAYFMSERWTEAEATVRPLLAEVPPNHPDWIHSMYGYAQILYELGRLDETEKYCNEIMAKISKTKAFPPDHPRTVSVAELLMKIYNLQGRESESAALKIGMPHIGVAKAQDRFDPYAIRRASAQSSRATGSPAAIRVRNDSPFRQPQSQVTSRSSTEDRDQNFDLVARRTF